MELSLFPLLSSIYLACSLIKANPTFENRMQSVLYIACQKCDYNTANAIIKEYPSLDPFAVLSIKAPAQVAEARGCRQIVQYFGRLKLIQLYQACERGDLGDVQRLYQQYPWIDITYKIPELNASPLDMALHKGHFDIVDYHNSVTKGTVEEYYNRMSEEEYDEEALQAPPIDDEDF